MATLKNESALTDYLSKFEQGATINKTEQFSFVQGNNGLVGWNDGSAKDASYHHSQTSTGEATKITDGGTSDEGSKLAHYRCHSGQSWSTADLIEQAGRVEILTSVRDAVESAHENDHVDEEEPVLSECGVRF